MQFIRNKTSLVFFVLLILLAPTVFLGLDFTDFGFHFINQKSLSNFDLFLNTSAYFWLSNLIPGVAISATGSFMLFKALGVILWCIIGIIFYRGIQPILATIASRTNQSLLAFCVIPGILISTKPITAGALVIPDYYTMALLPLTWIALNLSRIKKDSSDFTPLIVFTLLALLPAFRWPLLLTSFIGSFIAPILISPKNLPSKWILRISPFLMISLLLLYKTFFLEVYSDKVSAPNHGIQKLFSIYVHDTIDLLKNIVVMLIVTFGLRTLVLASKHRDNPLMHTAIAVVFIALAAFREVFAQNSVSPGQQLILISAGYLIYHYWHNDRTTGYQATIRYTLIALLFIGLYPLGSDTGLVKMGYLSFLVIAPATYLFAKSLQRPSLQYLFIGFINVMALMYMYNSLYRDDIAEITREPAIIQDHFLGIVITTENNKRILMAYKSILEKVEPSADRIVTAPRAPLLGAYSKKLYTRLSWPEIKSSAALDTEIKQICSSPEKVTLILSKVNFSSPQRTLADPSSLSPLPKIWETYCGKRLITENYLFLALSNKGH